MGPQAPQSLVLLQQQQEVIQLKFVQLLQTEKFQRTIVFIPLLLMTVIWGFSFIFQIQAAKHLPPFTTNALRFAMGALLLAVFTFIASKRTAVLPEAWSSPRLLRSALLIGGLLFLSITLQQTAMSSSTAGNAGFITNMDVVILPFLIVIFQRKRVPLLIWIAVTLSVLGLILISFASIRFATGDLLVVGVAFLAAFKSLTLGEVAKNHNPFMLSTLIFTFVAFASTIGALLFEKGVAWQDIDAALPSLLYLGLISTAVAYTLQVVSHRKIDPVSVSMFTNLEAVFAAFAGWLLLGELLDAQTLLGFSILFVAIFLTILKYKPEEQTNQQASTKEPASAHRS